MKKLFILLFLSTFACKKDLHPVLVDDEKAVALLFDLNISNIALNKYPINMRDSMSVVYKAQICDIHKFEEEELDTTLWMLQNDFERYNSLYQKLRDSLEALQNDLGDIDPASTYEKKYNNSLDSLKTKNR